MLWPKKNAYKEFDNEKKFLRLENFFSFFLQNAENAF